MQPLSKSASLLRSQSVLLAKAKSVPSLRTLQRFCSVYIYKFFRTYHSLIVFQKERTIFLKKGGLVGNEILEWAAIQEHSLLFYKQLNEQVITNQEYLVKKEIILRGFLRANPTHERCQQALADVLQKRLASEQLSLEEETEIYMELVNLSTLMRFKEGLAKNIYTQHAPNNSFEALQKLLAKALYPKKAEWLYRLFTEDLLDLQNLSSEQFDDLETYLTILNKTDASQKIYNRKLAQLKHFNILKEVNDTSIPLLQVYEGVKDSYKECIRLDPTMELYRTEWLHLLATLENELSSQQQHEEVLMNRVEIGFEILQYEPTNNAIRSEIENILLEHEAVIYDNQDDGLITKREATDQLNDVYSNLVKVRPQNERYKYSLAKLKMARGRTLKTAYQLDEAFRVFNDVLKINSEHFDAVLRKANIHILKSQWPEAHQLLSSLVNRLERISGRDAKIEFCLIYAAANAYVNEAEAAERWLKKRLP